MSIAKHHSFAFRTQKKKDSVPIIAEMNGGRLIPKQSIEKSSIRILADSAVGSFILLVSRAVSVRANALRISGARRDGHE